MKNLLAMLFVLLASGCANLQQPTYTLSRVFDRPAAAALMAPGANSIAGNAFLRQAGGGVVSCAGSPVVLVPATAYATERILAIYQSAEGGLAYRSVKFQPESQEFAALTRKTSCDSAGNFTFDAVADGDFYLVTQVVWMLGSYNRQGGVLARRITVSGGKVTRIVMSG
jgi:hypothetical protein